MTHNGKEESKKEMTCSFCRKCEEEVGKLVKGLDHAYICHGCVKLCREIFNSARYQNFSGTIEEFSEMIKGLTSEEMLQCLKASLRQFEPIDVRLHYAAAEGDIIAMTKLLDQGADINACDKELKTALFCSIDYRQTEAALFLIERGAHVNHCNKNDVLLLHQAVMKNQTEVVAALLDKGAEPDWRDNKGKTPLDYALEKNHTEAIELLLLRKYALTTRSQSHDQQ